MSVSPVPPAVVACFAVTVFLSAFLLFQVQPLISKFILPWFGGSPAVWTTCMLFFQSLLFLGYTYAHLLTTRLSTRNQVIGHVLLMVAAAAMLPITPGAEWKPAGDAPPVLSILTLLTACVGLPYFVLSSTGPLLQKWFSQTRTDGSPYRLYALSNAGSLLALLSFPFVVEPAWSSQQQTLIWSWSFGMFVLSCTACSVLVSRYGKHGCTLADGTDDDCESGPVTAGDRWTWFGLACAASVMLLATTNHVCLDIATVPFLWILPLVLYLLSFILTFDSDRWYSRRWFGWSLLAFSSAAIVMVVAEHVSAVPQIIIHFGAMFCMFMVCHGELVLRKPGTRQLTQFYLIISAGGACGGLLIALVAPVVFPVYLEYPLGLVACVGMSLSMVRRSQSGFIPTVSTGRPSPVQTVVMLSVIAAVVGMGGYARNILLSENSVIRNFYGVLRVETGEVELPDSDNGPEEMRQLTHGRTLHGRQFMSEKRRRQPTTYYTTDSGIGLAMQDVLQGPERRVGVVGLGVGTLAAYGRPGDHFVMYEINDAVIRLASEKFTFLKDSPADVELVLGDARLSMEHESPRQFDLLVLDAFSSDAIPTHLMTAEAMQIWMKHVKPDGKLAFHISNRFFDLAPLVRGMAAEHGFQTIRITVTEPGTLQRSSSIWILLSREPFSHALLSARDREADDSRRILWADDHVNLLQILR
ncbi:MAG: fused MFS/spermidine synthase [Planctomycetaceae bacterium]